MITTLKYDEVIDSLIYNTRLTVIQLGITKKYNEGLSENRWLLLNIEYSA